MTRPPSKNLFWPEQTLVAFDTETTGIWAPANRLVEIGAVKFKPETGTIDKFQALINPERTIPEEVIEIHGITDEMVADSELAGPVLERFIEFCGSDSILVAHNAPFDISFLAVELDRAGLKFTENPVIDTVDIYRRYFRGLKSYSLLNLSKDLQIADSQEHRALGDAVLVQKLMDNAFKKLHKVRAIEDLEKTCTVYRIDNHLEEVVDLPPEFAELPKIISDKLHVRVDYATKSGTTQERTILPKQLFKLGTKIYVNAYCEWAKAERTFRLDRMSGMRVVEG